MAEKKEIQKVKQAQPVPVDLISNAIANGADLESLEKLLEMQMKYEANESRKAYNFAMSSFKQNPPTINKDRQVGYSTSKGKVGYSHASLFNIVDKITAELSKNELSASWRTDQTGNVVKVTCRISHSEGHYEETSLSADADVSGAKNSIQAIGSTITYLQRYSLLAITGLATQDQDNDGQIESAKIDENKVKNIKDTIEKFNIDLAKVLSYMKVEKIEDINSEDFAKVKIMLKQAEKATK